MTRFAQGRGGRLAFCEWGDPDGAVVFHLHGVPGSRYLRHVGDAYRDARLRVITYDRPGYGLSDRVPGRTVEHTASDVAAIADALGVDRFSVVGVSAGGVHALAAAARLSDRVERCVGIKALAVFHGEGLDFYDGMDPDTAAVFRAADDGDHAALEADAAETLAWVESGLPGIDPTATDVAMLQQAFREAFRQGPAGQLDDLFAHVRHRGHDLGSVVAPTLLLAARDDQQVPPGHGRWLADQLPDARLLWLDGGHLDRSEADEARAMVWAGHGSVHD